MTAIKLIEIYNKIKNRLFSIVIFGRLDIYVDSTAEIKGLSNIYIGKNFYAGRSLWLEAVLQHNCSKYNPKILIKNNVAINDFVHIGATNYIEIGNNVLMASKIFITDHNHGIYSGHNQTSPTVPPNERFVTNDKNVIIKDNVWIGEFVTILPGVTIGEGSIIGSNSVVTKNIPPFCIAVGNPARVVKKYDQLQQKWLPL